jgi:hypothetical protein
MEDRDFRSGNIEIQWLERKLPELSAVRPPADTSRAAAIAAALLADRDRQRGQSGGRPNGQTGKRADALDAWTQAARLEGLR